MSIDDKIGQWYQPLVKKTSSVGVVNLGWKLYCF